MRPTRREIIGTGIAAAAGGLARAAGAAVVPGTTPAAPGGITAQMRLSCAAYSLRQYLPRDGKKNKLSMHDVIELGALWRLDGIELTSYYFDSQEKSYLHSLKAKAFLYGLDVSGTSVGNNFCLPAGAQRDEQIAMVKRWIDVAVEIGAPVIRVFAGKSTGDRARDLAAVIECSKVCTELAASRGVFLAIENHGYLTETAEDVLKIVDGVKNPWFGINLDTGNFVRDPYTNIALAAPKAITTHVKVTVVGPDGKQRVDADYPRIVKVLREANYRGYLSLEYEGKEDPMTGVPKVLRKIRDAMNGIER